MYTDVISLIIILVDGQWSRWSEWQSCSVSCGIGIRFRTRECNDPEPLHGGLPCIGESQDTEECELDECSSMYIFTILQILKFIYLDVLKIFE